MKQFDLRDREFLVANLAGKFYCLDGRCTHAGSPLAEGTLKGEILTCSWHYSRFNITDGSVVNGFRIRSPLWLVAGADSPGDRR